MRGTERGVGFHVLFDAVLEEVGGLRGRPVRDASGLPGEVPGVVNARFRRPNLKKKKTIKIIIHTRFEHCIISDASVPPWSLHDSDAHDKFV